MIQKALLTLSFTEAHNILLFHWKAALSTVCSGFHWV